MEEVNMTSLPRIQVFTDGSYRKSFCCGGYAALLRSSSGDFQLVFGNQTGAPNGRMELYAVVNALRYLNQPCFVEVISDSVYVVKGINEWIHRWVYNGWKSSTTRQTIANQDLWQELWSMMQTHHLSATWVKGHSGHPENEIVDYAANWSAGKPF